MNVSVALKEKLTAQVHEVASRIVKMIYTSLFCELANSSRMMKWSRGGHKGKTRFKQNFKYVWFINMHWIHITSCIFIYVLEEAEKELVKI